MGFLSSRMQINSMANLISIKTRGEMQGETILLKKNSIEHNNRDNSKMMPIGKSSKERKSRQGGREEHITTIETEMGRSTIRTKSMIVVGNKGILLRIFLRIKSRLGGSTNRTSIRRTRRTRKIMEMGHLITSSSKEINNKIIIRSQEIFIRLPLKSG